MKWLLTFNIYLAAVGTLAAAEPAMPMNALPYPSPGMATMSTMPTVPQPTLTGTTGWTGDGSPSCASTCQPKRSLSALERLCEWVSFRPCPPVHQGCVPQPARAPLRSYFTHSECGVGCANATDCGRGGRSCGGTSEAVNIPLPQRSCASARCGSTPVWGRNSCGGSGCSSGLLNRFMGCFGLSGSSCGGKSSCGGLGGCSTCQYTKVPMSDIGQYHNFTTTQSVGRTGALSSVGVAPAGAHFANPYQARSAELQYATPAATLAPAQTMPPPAPTGTNPFPGPQGTLPYSKPFTNP